MSRVSVRSLQYDYRESSRVLGSLALAVAFVLFVASCKQNNVDASSVTTLGIGQQCLGAEDEGCGVGAVCALGYCRSGCTTDAECPQGALCVGDRAPYGCTLPPELACSSTQPCAAPLTCGLDGKCRNGCRVSSDCIRNEQACIAGACVSASDPDKRWSDCAVGESACGAQAVAGLRCSGVSDRACNELFVCHRGAPGWSSVGACDVSGTSGNYNGCRADNVTNGGREARCHVMDGEGPISGCVTVPTVAARSDGCALLLPLALGFPCESTPAGPPATYALLLDGAEVADGFTTDCSAGKMLLSPATCSRLAARPAIQVRICSPS